MSFCKSCGAPIVWCRTRSGTRIPLDPEPVAGGNLVKDAFNVVAFVQPDMSATDRYVSHFATCPQAKTHRRTRERGQK